MQEVVRMPRSGRRGPGNTKMSLFSCCLGDTPVPEASGRTTNRKVRTKKSPITFTLLLLGTEGSGKSTFIRQMQVIHGKGFNEEERLSYVQDIYKNIFDAMTVLTQRMESFNLWLSNPRLEGEVVRFLDEEAPISVRLNAVRLLWEDEAIQECYRRRAEYPVGYRLAVSAKYFLDGIERINEQGYLPITDDIVRVRTPSFGISQYEFTVNEIQFKIVDVGGDKVERRKWIEFLQATTTCVIFLAAIDEYDVLYHETEQGEVKLKNRLKESIELFKEIGQYEWLNHATFILFLNKMDLFREKIRASPIWKHFPEYKGFQDSVEDGQDYLKKQFLSSAIGRRMLYSHYTCATDTENMRVVFGCVKDTVLLLNLQQYNLL